MKTPGTLALPRCRRRRPCETILLCLSQYNMARHCNRHNDVSIMCSGMFVEYVACRFHNNIETRLKLYYALIYP